MNDLCRMIHHRAAIVAALAALILTGCAALGGIGGSSEYACKAPPGVKCDSVSGTYANALQGGLPSQRKSSVAPASEETVNPTKAPTGTGKPSVGVGSRASLPVGELRSQPRVLRLWVKAYEDTDSDLVGDQRIYVRVDNGRWLVDHYQRAQRAAFRPVKAPPPQAAQSTPSQPDNAPAGPTPARSSIDGPSLAQRLNAVGFGNFPPGPAASSVESPKH